MEALETALSGIATDMTSTVGSVVPIAVGIIGSVMVVIFGVKLFKKLTGRA